MTISCGSKLFHHSNELVAICVELGDNLGLFSPIMHILLDMFMVNFHMTLALHVPIFLFIVVYVVYSHLPI